MHGLGEQLVAVVADPVQVDRSAGHRPEAASPRLVAVPVVAVRSAGENTGAGVVLRAAAVRCAVAVDTTGQHALHGGDLGAAERSEEHTSELQSRENLVCR